MRFSPCKHCGSTSHTSIACFKAPRKRIKPQSDKAKTSKLAMERIWFKVNPPDLNGNWVCYLQISADCPKILDFEHLTLEHVIPKVKAPQLKFDYTNIKPACEPCNRLKASKTIEKLSEEYPHLVYLLKENQTAPELRL